MMSPQVEKLLDDVRFYVGAKHYGQALTQLEELNRLIQADTEGRIDFQLKQAALELEQTTQEQAREAVANYQRGLDDLIQAARNDIHQFNLQTAQETLDLYRRALTDENDFEYANRQSRVQALRARWEEQRQYDATREQVDDLIAQAQNLRRANPNVASNELMRYYDEARNIAREAATSNPQNYALQALRSLVEAQRERMGEETAALTSGALLGDIERVLAFIDSAAEDQLIPVYNERNILTGAFPKAEARQRVLDIAPTMAQTVADKHMTEALRALEDFKPRAALEILAQSEKYSAFLRVDTRRDMNELEAEVRQAVRQLEEAEATAQQAVTLLQGGQSNALAAWEQYQAALRVYEGAKFQNKLREAESTILEYAQQEVQQVGEQVEAMLRAERLEEGIALAERTLTRYRDLQKVGALVTLERLRGDAADRKKAKESILRSLEEAGANIQDNLLSTAQTTVQNVEATHRASGLLDDPTIREVYTQVKASLDARLKADEQLASLRQLLTSANRTRIEEAILTAETAANSNPARQTDYLALAEQLRLHLKDLDARNLEAGGQLEDALKLLEELRRNPGLTRTQQEGFEARYLELEERYNTETGNRDTLQRAKEWVKDRPSEVFAMLGRRFTPINAVERVQAQRLREEAKNNWLDSIEVALKQADIEKPPAPEVLDGYVTALRDLDPDLYRRYDPLIGCLKLVGQAQQAQQAGRRAEALARFTEALKFASSGRELQYLNGEIARLEKDIREAETDLLLADVNAALGVSDELLTRLEQARNELNQLATQSGDSDYQLLMLEVMLVLAQFTPDVEASRTLFTQASALATRLAPQYATRKELEPLFKRARRGPEIGRARASVEADLRPSADLSMFSEAKRLWEQAFQGMETDMPYLWRWYERAVDGLTAQLQNQVGNQEVRTDNMEARARLLILNPNHEKGRELLARLPNMEAELVGQTETLLRELTARHKYEPRKGQAMIQNQIEELQRHLGYLDTTYRVVDRFKALISQESNLANSLQRLRALTEEALRLVEGLRKLASDFMNYLGGVEEQVSQQELENQWNSLLDGLQKLTATSRINSYADLKEHPILKELEDRKRETLSLSEKLEADLRLITDAIKEERFDSDLLTKAEAVADLFKQHYRRQYIAERARNFSVIDTFNGGRVTGWDRVYALIQERKDALDRITLWAHPFTAEATPNDENMLRVIDWEAIRQEAELLIQQARFDEAQTTIEDAIYERDTDSKIMALENALEKLGHPPLSSEAAGSDRGRRLIRSVQNSQGEKLRRALQEARALLEQIERYRRDIENANRQFQRGLQQMEESRGLLRRGAYREGFETAQAAVTQISRISPRHTNLNKMRARLKEYEK